MVMMESAEKKVKGKLADLKFILQYIYTRFCQANCFTGRFAETIIEDLKDLQDLISKVKLNGDKLLDSLKGTHAEEVNAICSASGLMLPSSSIPSNRYVDPILEVMIRIVFLKSTVLPCESVIRPSSRT